MTNYELEKLTKGIAAEIIRTVKEDERFLDILVPPRTMDIKEASKFLHIPINTIYSMKNEIPHFKVGKRLLFSDRDLIRFLKRKQKEGKA